MEYFKIQLHGANGKTASDYFGPKHGSAVVAFFNLKGSLQTTASPQTYQFDQTQSTYDISADPKNNALAVLLKFENKGSATGEITLNYRTGRNDDILKAESISDPNVRQYLANDWNN